MIDKTKFTEILPGLWYENTTGLPYSAKKHGRSLQGFNDFLKPLTSKTEGYFMVKENGLMNAWHRVVYKYFKGEIPKGFQVDHVNNIRSDNRICNLKVVPEVKNKRKRLINSNNTTGYAGVRQRIDSGKFEARINIFGKRIVLGSFDTPEEAYKVYLDAKVKHHGVDSIKPLKEKKEG